MRGVEHLAHTREKRNTYRCQGVKVHFGDLGTDGRKIQWILKQLNGAATMKFR
jgi:hypothetical protein